MNRSVVGVLAVTAISLASLAQAQAAPPSPFPPDAQIRQVLAERVNTKEGIGIVVGVIEPAGRRVVAYGNLAKGDRRPLDGETIFEIGSATKVFTSLLLCEMVQREEVALSDPVAKYLPAGITVPERDGRAITLQDLSTHTSGLPRLPGNLSPKDLANPYADYSVEQLYQFLSSYELTRDIGSQYEYSNLGAGLLGHALARRAGVDYDALVRSRISGPLGMTSTGIALSPEQKARLAAGHNEAMETTPSWDLPTLAGAGGLRSSANDLLLFLAANLGYSKSPLDSALSTMLKVRRPTGAPDLEIALGWHVFTRNGTEVVWHNGGTGGYRSFIGFDPKSRTGVVVLSNAVAAAGEVDDIGQHLLDPQVPLREPPKQHKEIAVNSRLLDGLVGQYELMPGFVLTVTREGGRLFVQATGQPKLEVYPESPREYFYKVVDAQITFETDGSGHATALVLHQNGANQRAKLIDTNLPPQEPSKEHTEIAVDPRLLDGLVGQYELLPGFVLTVTRESSHLFVQATGQPKLEVYPESPNDYFYKVVDAQITFETDSRGHATALVLHQNGANQRARRVE
ncbi:MAG TPA: serine hydrolase [Thermoanaerobaculaceae bacterium]|nr:serine hydrolase [Thermoanaerobaculaceae bacterium]HPS76860.1 serine hydrolase [Thermoanaerobaculaceae bacterium]